MPRYFMHIRRTGSLSTDPEGVELPDLEQARREAQLDARELIADRIRSGKMIGDDRFEIADERGNILAMVPFRDAIRFQ